MLFALACFAFGATLVIGTEYLRGIRKLRRMADLPLKPVEGTAWPKISVIISALNEATTIEEGLGSVLSLDYPNLEVILINDRSTDGTGEILENMASSHPQLKVFHIKELPDGWLGKNHAIHFGSTKATGDYFLFTDADVVFEPTTLRRVMGYVLDQELDHLTATPFVNVPGFWLNLAVGTFTVFFNTYMRPWAARDPKSSAFVGIGAFNFMSRRAYAKSGTYQAIAMRPDEDIRMGQLIKKAGLRQDIVIGRGCISVKWYLTLGEMIRGLEKNLYAGLNYRFFLLVFFSFAMFFLCIFPFPAMFFTTGVTRLLNVGSVAILFLCYRNTAHYRCGEAWYGWLFFMGSSLYLFVIWRSTLKTIFQGGIYWRGTFYSLEKLKTNR